MKVKAVNVDYDPSTDQVHINPVEPKVPVTIAPPVVTPPVATPPVTPVAPETVPPVVETPSVETPPVETKKPTDGYDDKKLAEYLSKKLQREIKSLDDLNKPTSKAVEKFLEFEKNTGRGFEDFVKANRDFNSMTDDQILTEYVLQENEGFELNDAVDHLDDLFGYEEDAPESDKKKKERLEKSFLAKAKKHFKEQSEKYKVPLESKGTQIPEEYVKALQQQKDSIQRNVDLEEQRKIIRSKFEQETDKLFSQDFKGFEINLGENVTGTYKPSDLKATKEGNSNIENFLGKFFDKDGNVKDAVGYHKALTVASNPEDFAKYFYEKGKSEAIKNKAGGFQNIQNVHSTRPSTQSAGTVRPYEPNTNIPTGKLRLKDY